MLFVIEIPESVFQQTDRCTVPPSSMYIDILISDDTYIYHDPDYEYTTSSRNYRTFRAEGSAVIFLDGHSRAIPQWSQYFLG